MMKSKVTVVDHYAVLGVARDASTHAINAAYKRLALRLHPDKAGSDKSTIERFQKVQDAVELLRDSARRAQLDALLKPILKRQPSPCPSDNWSTCGTPDSEVDDLPKPFPGPSIHKQYQRTNPVPDPFSTDTQHQKRPYHNVFEPQNGQQSQQSKRRRRQRQPQPMPMPSMSSNKDRYNYSFGNSVHMDPESAESKASKAQFRADNIRWQQEWAGIDPNVEKAREEARKKAMEDQMVRERNYQYMQAQVHAQAQYAQEKRKRSYQRMQAQAQLEQDERERQLFEENKKKKVRISVDPFDQAFQNAVNGMKFHHEPNDNSKTAPAHYKKPVPFFSSCVSSDPADWSDREHKAKQPAYRKPTTEEDDPLYFEGASSPGYTFGDSSSNQSPISSDSVQSHTASKHSRNSSDSSSSMSFSFKLDSNNQTSPSKPLEATPLTTDTLMKTFLTSHKSALDHLAPFFKQKLAKSAGHYTVDDMATELNALVLESFTGWLEEMRRSLPDAIPESVRNAPEACAHLGSWHHEARDKCATCHFPTPLFALTCSSCGHKACTHCKFNDVGDASLL